MRLEVRTDIEHPRELTQPVTALFVVVENRSGRDLAIRPEAFNLLATGRKHPAIPADRLRRSESSVEADIAVAMRALPHDVLASGGRTDGFVYFDGLNVNGPLTLTFELRGPDATARFGLISVPLTKE